MGVNGEAAVRVRVNPPGDDEKRALTPLGVKVRYAIAMAAFFIVAIGTAVAIRNTQQLQSQAATQAQFHQQLLQSCTQENTVRRSDNNAHYGDFVVFSFVAKRFLVPTPTETPAQKKITNEFAGALQHAVTDATWTPPTDCRLAVGTQGLKYTSPAPVAFTTRLPPPSALPGH